MKTTVDLYTDGEFVYVMVRGLQYAIGPLDQFALDHPRLFDTMMKDLRAKKYLV